jgi:hypothetical protein
VVWSASGSSDDPDAVWSGDGAQETDANLYVTSLSGARSRKAFTLLYSTLTNVRLPFDYSYYLKYEKIKYKVIYYVTYLKYIFEFFYIFEIL